MAEGEVTFTKFTRDGDGDFYLQEAHQVGKNNSASLLPFNSIINAPKNWTLVSDADDFKILNGGGIELKEFLSNS